MHSTVLRPTVSVLNDAVAWSDHGILRYVFGQQA
jgi:hypothetical protein